MTIHQNSVAAGELLELIGEYASAEKHSTWPDRSLERCATPMAKVTGVGYCPNLEGTKRFTLMLLMVLVACNKPQPPTRTKAVPQPDPKYDWFVAQWKASPNDDWFAVEWKASPNGDRFGATATLLHHNNIYKARCSSLSIIYEKSVSGRSKNPVRGQLPCSILAGMLGKVSPSLTGHTTMGIPNLEPLVSWAGGKSPSTGVALSSSTLFSGIFKINFVACQTMSLQVGHN